MIEELILAFLVDSDDKVIELLSFSETAVMCRENGSWVESTHEYYFYDLPLHLVAYNQETNALDFWDKVENSDNDVEIDELESFFED